MTFKQLKAALLRNTPLAAALAAAGLSVAAPASAQTTTTRVEGVTNSRSGLEQGRTDGVYGIAGTDHSTFRGTGTRVVKRAISDEDYRRSLFLDTIQRVVERDTSNSRSVLRTNGEYAFWRIDVNNTPDNTADDKCGWNHGIIAATQLQDDARNGYVKKWKITSGEIDAPCDQSTVEAAVIKATRAQGKPATVGEVRVDGTPIVPAPPPPPPAPEPVPVPPPPPPPPPPAPEPEPEYRAPTAGIFAGATLPVAGPDTKGKDAGMAIAARGNVRVIGPVHAAGTVVAGDNFSGFNLQEATAGVEIRTDGGLIAGVQAGRITAGTGTLDAITPTGNRALVGQMDGLNANRGTGLRGYIGADLNNFDLGAYVKDSTFGGAQFTEYGGNALFDNGRQYAGGNVTIVNARAIDGNEGVNRNGLGIALGGGTDLGGEPGGLGLGITGTYARSRTETPVAGMSSVTKEWQVHPYVSYTAADAGVELRAGPTYGSQSIVNTCCGITREYNEKGFGGMLSVVFRRGNESRPAQAERRGETAYVARRAEQDVVVGPNGPELAPVASTPVAEDRDGRFASAFNGGDPFFVPSGAEADARKAQFAALQGATSQGFNQCVSQVLDNETCTILADWARANPNQPIRSVRVTYEGMRAPRDLNFSM